MPCLYLIALIAMRHGIGMVIFTAHRTRQKTALYNGLLTNYFFVRHCITRRVGRIGFAPELKQARSRIHPDAFA